MNQSPSFIQSQSGSLTPIANSPLPFDASQLSTLVSTIPRPSIPMVSLNQPISNAPTIDEIDSLAQKIADMFANQQSASPFSPISLTNSSPSISLPSVNTSLPRISLPSINNPYQNITLPTVPLPSVNNSYQNTPLPTISLPSVGNSYQNIPLPPINNSYQNTPLPTISLPPINNSYQNTPLPTVNPLPSIGNTYQNTPLPTISLPTVSLPTVNMYQNTQLPTVGNTLGNNNSDVYFGSKQLATFGSLSTFRPSILADNEVGDLRWNRQNPPRPIEVTSSYRRVGCIGDGSCFFHAVSKGLSEVYQLSYYSMDNITEEILQKFEGALNNRITFPSGLFTTQRQMDPNTVYEFGLPYGKLAFDNLMSQFRGAYVQMLRQDFANQVLNNIRMHELIRDKLSGSIDLNVDILISQASERGQRLTRDQVYDQAFQNVRIELAQELLSGDAVQPDFMLLISDYVDIDIYLLRDADLINPNPRVSPLYSGSSLHASVHGPINLRPNNDIYEGLNERRAIVIISIDDYHYEIVARVDDVNIENLNQRQIHPNMNQSEPLIQNLYEMLTNIRMNSM